MREMPDQRLLLRAAATLVQRQVSARAALLAGTAADAITSGSVIERAWPTLGNKTLRTDHG